MCGPGGEIQGSCAPGQCLPNELHSKPPSTLGFLWTVSPITQADPQLQLFLSRPPECWDHRDSFFFFCKLSLVSFMRNQTGGGRGRSKPQTEPVFRAGIRQGKMTQTGTDANCGSSSSLSTSLCLAFQVHQDMILWMCGFCQVLCDNSEKVN